MDPAAEAVDELEKSSFLKAEPRNFNWSSAEMKQVELSKFNSMGTPVCNTIALKLSGLRDH